MIRALLATLLLLTTAAAAAEVDHDIDVRFDPESRDLELIDRVMVPAGAETRFRLAPWLTLIDAEAAGRVVSPRRDGAAWQVALPAGADVLTLRLRGTVPSLPAGGRRQGWSGAGAGADGSAVTAWSGWLPDFGRERLSFRLNIEVPAGQRAVATGRLVDETLSPAGHRATYVSDRPGEPPSFFVGPYVVAERRQGALRLRTWFHPELAPLADAYLDSTAQHIARYAAAIGDYPYGDFHVVSAPLPVGLGFPALTYVGRRVLPLPFMRGRSLAHEVLHSWWGNAVGVAYDQGNWAEGLTTYMADYALAAERSAAAAREMRLRWLRDYAALPADRDTPVIGFVSKRHQAAQVIGYNKAAFVFHMLRQEIGDAAFDDGVRRFWQRHRFAVAAWSDLQAAFEAASGRDLAWFFQQWLTRPGAPALSLDAVRSRRDGDGHRLGFELRQAGAGYRLRVPVVIETGDGRRQHWLELKDRTLQAAFRLDAPPQSLKIDPDLDLFRRLAPGESPPILRDVTLAENAVVLLAEPDPGVRAAAERLAGRLFDAGPQIRAVPAGAPPAVPALVIGRRPAIAALLAAPSWQLDRNAPAGGHSAVAWTARRGDGQPVLVVSGDDAAALLATVRPLPHYRGKSYIRFSGRRAVDNGVWPPGDSPLTYRFAAD